MDADLDLLLTTVCCNADDLLPEQAGNAGGESQKQRSPRSALIRRLWGCPRSPVLPLPAAPRQALLSQRSGMAVVFNMPRPRGRAPLCCRRYCCRFELWFLGFRSKYQEAVRPLRYRTSKVTATSRRTARGTRTRNL